MFFLLSACSGGAYMSYDFVPVTVSANDYDIFTYQRISDSVSPVHIYIEGDGRAFNGRGRPTSNPTPRGDLMRELAMRDSSANVIYMARPCQYIMSKNCDVADWTHGRFSRSIINSVSSAVKQVAKNRPVVLIGYSGGAMVSGLVIQNNPDLMVEKWITIAGVLNHVDWTEYFGDSALYSSMNMSGLPQVNQLHYIADGDTIVPNKLSHQWIADKNLVVIPGASHSDFSGLSLDF